VPLLVDACFAAGLQLFKSIFNFSSVDFASWLAVTLLHQPTTAKPLPCSPALAASYRASVHRQINWSCSGNVSNHLPMTPLISSLERANPSITSTELSVFVCLPFNIKNRFVFSVLNTQNSFLCLRSLAASLAFAVFCSNRHRFLFKILAELVIIEDFFR